MRRAACLLIAGLAGCDAVWDLERPADPPITDDEDGDGQADTLDGCPHLPNASSVDTDKDGVPDDCDSDPMDPGTEVVFASFATGVPSMFDVQGAVGTEVPGEITFGTTSEGLTTIVLKNVVTDTMVIDIGFEILENTIEGPTPTGTYDEIGLYGANRDFTSRPLRGNVCFYGIIKDKTVPDRLYTELVEDAGSSQTKFTGGGFVGTTGRMRFHRTPDTYDCAVYRNGLGIMSDNRDVEGLEAPGRVAISAERTIVKLRYIFVAYQPLGL